MTVIAWDGRYLVADKQASTAGLVHPITKIKVLRRGLAMAYTASSDSRQLLEDWYMKDLAVDPRTPYPFPDSSSDSWGRLIIVKDGRLHWYETRYTELSTEDKHMSFGSGRDYAMGILAVTNDARIAVKVTCSLCESCGLGMTVYDSTTDEIYERTL